MNLKFWLLDIWSNVEEGVETTHLIGFDQDNRKIEIIDRTVRPFLLAEYYEQFAQSPIDELRADVQEVEKIIGLELRKFWKIFGLDASHDIPRFRDILENNGIEHYESDVFYTQVYMKERGFKPSSWHYIFNANQLDENTYELTEKSVVKPSYDKTIPLLKLCVCDIECYNPKGGMPDVEKDPIIVFGIKSKRGNRLIQNTAKDYDDYGPLYAAREEIISEIEADIIGTYNGNEFDWQYIADRANSNNDPFRIGIDGTTPHKSEWSTIEIRGRPTIDLYGLTKFFLPKGRRKNLPRLHEELAKNGHVPKRKFYDINRDMIAKLWDNPKSRFEVINHCESDVTFTYDILEFALPFAIELSQLTNIPLDQVLSVPYTVLIEGFLMEQAHKTNRIIPRAEFHEARETIGAVCLEPVKGLLENIAVFDFAAMYPNIVVEKNVSPETLEELNPSNCYGIEGEEGKKFYFKKEPKGFFAEAMEVLLRKIEEAKEEYKEIKFGSKYAGPVQARKTLARAMYGYMKPLTSKTRWFSEEAMEAVAVEGRNRVLKAINKVEEEGVKVVYADTDSLFVEWSPDVNPEEFAEWLSEEMGTNVGFDKFYNLLFFTEAKKIYAGLLHDGSLDIVGFIKGDWCFIANKTQEKLFEMILKERNVRGARELVRVNASFIRKGIYPLEAYIIWKGLNKPLNQYHNKMPHVEVARRNPESFVEEDGTVGFIICKSRNAKDKLYMRAKHYTEVTDMNQIDKEYYEKQLKAVSERILKYFGGRQELINKYSEV